MDTDTTDERELEECSFCARTALLDDSDLCDGCNELNLLRCIWCNTLYDYDAESYYVAYCRDCYHSIFTHCDGCGDEIKAEDALYSSDRTLCDYCYNTEYSVVKDYSADVLDFLDADDDRRLFGAELEVAVDTDCYSVFDTASMVEGFTKNNAILKADSSIPTDSYDGFEIVTRPMNMANQMAFWDKFAREKPSYLVSDRAGTCGFHIHVTKKSMSSLTIGKLLVFLNEDANARFIRLVARRYDCGYARKKEDCKVSDAKKRPSSRYEMLNLSKHSTIEFRIFKGTCNVNTIKAYFQFVENLILFCEATPVKYLNVHNYRKFILRKGSKTEILRNYIKERERLCA